jgi:3-oxoacyl-[acyl-carrier protein] reductase
MPADMDGKVALVTGSSRGIGKSIALRLAKGGSNVAVTYQRRSAEAAKVVDEIRGMKREAIAVGANITSREEVAEMVRSVEGRFGKIDILVNNAGLMKRHANSLEISDQDWKDILGVNLIGAYNCIWAVAPGMVKRRYGKIVNIASTSGLGNNVGGLLAYATTKAALIMLTKKMAMDLGGYKVNVNAVAPGAVRTEMIHVGRTEEEVQKMIEERSALAALKRISEPEEVANAVAFLSSDQSSFITGQVLMVDGGMAYYLSHSV